MPGEVQELAEPCHVAVDEDDEDVDDDDDDVDDDVDHTDEIAEVYGNGLAAARSDEKITEQSGAHAAAGSDDTMDRVSVKKPPRFPALTPMRKRREVPSGRKSSRMVTSGAKRPRQPDINVGTKSASRSVLPNALGDLRKPPAKPRRSSLSDAASDQVEDAGDDNLVEDASADEEEMPRANIPRPTWCRMTQRQDAAPKMLAGHAAVTHSGFLFVFGGFDGGRAEDGDPVLPHSNGLYQYHPETDMWVTLSPNRVYDPDPRAPEPRRHASLVTEGGTLLVYGGFNARGETLGDLWEFQIDGRLWRHVQHHQRLQPDLFLSGEGPGRQALEEGAKISAFGTGCVLEAPGPRAEHTAVVFSNAFGRHMLVFGGYVAATVPFLARRDHVRACVYCMDCLSDIIKPNSNVMRSGSNRYDGKKKLNDTYAFNLDSREWYRPTNASANAPNRRCKHSTVLYDGKVWVTAGFQYNRGDNYANTDMHCLDLETFTWSPVLMDARCPDALQGHRAVVAGDSMYIVGGKVRGDTSAGSDGHSSGLNDAVYRYQFDFNRWSRLDTNGAKPPPRQLHAAVAVPWDEGFVSIFVCGGADKSRQAYFNDMWELRDVPSRRRLASDCTFCEVTGVLVNNPLFSDVTFVVEGQKVLAHRSILYSRCEYFRGMFEVGMRETTAKEISVPGVNYVVFLGVMEYIYTGIVTLTDGSQAVGLLQAADMFGLDALRQQCVEKVEKALTVDNAAYLCQVADTHNAYHLKHSCISFILHNFREVVKTDNWSSVSGAELGREILLAYADCCTFDPGAFRKRARLR